MRTTRWVTGSELAVAALEEVQAGVYLHDGTRLVEMVTLDDEGRFHLEDCSGDGALIVVDAESLVNDWKVVRRNGDDAGS